MAVGDFAFSEILTGTKKLYTKNTANETTVTTMQNAATAIGNGISLDVSGMGTAICQVSGTFVGTITFEASLDNSVFDSIDVQKISGGLISSVVTSTGFYKIPCNGVKYIRARVSSYTSGAITVNGYAEALSCSDNAIQLSGRKAQVLKIFNAQEIRDTEFHVSAVVDVSGFKDFDIMVISTNGTGINYDAYIYFPNDMFYWDKTASTWKNSKITGITTTQNPLPKSLRSALEYWPVGASQLRVEIKYNIAPTTGSITVEVWGVPN